MWLDQWLIQKFAKFFYARYQGALQPEMSKWLELAERERLARLRQQLGAKGYRVILRPGMQITAPEKINIGSYVGFGHHNVLRGIGGITIGDFVLVGDGVIISSVGHPINGVYYRTQETAPVVIRDNVWLAANVIILPGVTIGENSVIGAGAVVTEDIPPNSVAVGVPARVIRQFEPDLALIEQQKNTIRAKLGKSEAILLDED